MKKWMLIILGLILLLFLFFKFFGRISNGCGQPEKPKNVPIQAIWKGDCDGGSWIELVSMEEDTARFKIYRDWNGELILDADFVYENCLDFRLNKINWMECIAYFGNSLEIHSKYTTKNTICRLTPIYPAYYELKYD